LNGASFNHLELPQTQISRSRQYLSLNISETVRDTDIVTTCMNVFLYADDIILLAPSVTSLQQLLLV